VIPVGEVPSRMPAHDRRTALRCDVYREWHGSSNGHWTSRQDVDDRQGTIYEVAVPYWLRMTPEEAWRRVLDEKNREDVLRVLGALDQWRTATVEQVEALTDVAGLARGRTSLMSALWNAGLVDLGRWGTPWDVRQTPPHRFMLRPAFDTEAHQRLSRGLGWREWHSATAGLGWAADRQYPRHNVLAVEFGLRMSEWGNVGMVLGERLSSWELVAGVEGSPSAADVVLVRPDGLRVLVEVTASINSKIDAKVERLARMLHENPDVPMVGLFVVAPRHDRGHDPTSSMARQLSVAIERACRIWPGRAEAPTKGRIAGVNWQYLFQPGLVRDDARFLPAAFPADGDAWTDRHVLDPAEVALRAPAAFDGKAIIRNTQALRGIPWALREGGVELPVGGAPVRPRRKPDPTLARMMLAG